MTHYSWMWCYQNLAPWYEARCLPVALGNDEHMLGRVLPLLEVERCIGYILWPGRCEQLLWNVVQQLSSEPSIFTSKHISPSMCLGAEACKCRLTRCAAATQCADRRCCTFVSCTSPAAVRMCTTVFDKLGLFPTYLRTNCKPVV